MNAKDMELIRKMLKKQAKLDNAIMEEYGLTEINKDNLMMAILDEVGELTHELKGDWCWWKKTQPQVDEEKVLGELVDIWHFVLCEQNICNFGEMTLGSYLQEKEIVDTFLERLKSKRVFLPLFLTELVRRDCYSIETLIAITEYLGFTIEDVNKAYCDKNKVNYQRLKEGY
jgi:dimeric dUTPase (all-alpha-NTP-PPase superfamily)